MSKSSQIALRPETRKLLDRLTVRYSQLDGHPIALNEAMHRALLIATTATDEQLRRWQVPA